MQAAISLAEAMSKEITLYNYQQQAVNAARALMRQGKRSFVLCAPTGSGKSVIAAHIAQKAVAKGGRIAFVVERLTLLDQIKRHFADLGLGYGVVQGSHDDQDADVLLCSMQTIQREGRMPSGISLLVFDECHIAIDAQAKIIKMAECPAIGLTATPFTSRMDRVYEEIINIIPTQRLIDQGYLTGFSAFTAKEIDTSQVKVKTTGEWDAEGLGRETMKVVGDIAAEWRRRCLEVHGRTVKTIAFVANVASCSALIEQMAEIGATFKRITYLDKDVETRRRRIMQLETGQIDGLVSVDALGRGFDVKDIECVIMAAPIRKSFSRFIQQLGRGLRAAPDKATCLVNDHSGNLMRFGARMAGFFMNGHDDLRNEREPKGRNKGREWEPPEFRECGDCGYLNPYREVECGQCGALLVRVNIKTVPGEMMKYIPMMERLNDALWPQCCLEAQNHFQSKPEAKGTAEGRAKASYKALMGKWPTMEFSAAVGAVDVELQEVIKAAKRAAYEHFKRTGSWK